MALEVEGVDEPMPGAGDIVVPVGILQRIRHVDDAAEIPNPERRISRRKVPVLEPCMDLMEHGVEHIHRGGVEVRREETVSGRCLGDCNAFVDRADVGPVDADNRVRGGHGRVPAGDRSVFARENETGWARGQAFGDGEARRPVEHDAGRCARHGDRQAELGARVAVVERCDRGPVVRHPPRRGAARNEAPGVHQVRIDQVRLHRSVRHEVVLSVER